MTDSNAAPTTVSPVRSALAILVGFLALHLLGSLFGYVLYSLAPGEFPETGPTERGLLFHLAGALPNGLVAGLLVGRIAGASPIVHAGVLGGLVGFFGMMSSDQAVGLPGWYALGRVVLPTFAVIGGGAVAHLVRGRKA